MVLSLLVMVTSVIVVSLTELSSFFVGGSSSEVSSSFLPSLLIYSVVLLVFRFRQLFPPFFPYLYLSPALFGLVESPISMC